MENVVLDGGLDLVRARPSVLAGRIRECLNYEVGWQRGYSRIDGWERFDGHTSPSATDYWILVMPTSHITGVVADEVTELEWDFNDEAGDAGTMVDYVDSPSVGAPVSSFAIVFRTGRLRPAWGSTISPDDNDDWSFVLDENEVSVYKLSEVHGHHDDFLNTLSLYAEKLRAEVRPVPGGGTIVGLHYHEDQLYAIRDVANVTLPAGTEGTLIPGMYVQNAAGQIGEVLTTDSDTRTANIAPVSPDGFALDAGDTLDICLSIRFINGTGMFDPPDDALATNSGWAGGIGFVDTRDGSFDSGNALGVAVFVDPTVTAPVELPEIFTNQTNTGSIDMESLMFPDTANAVTVESASARSEVATMWRSTDDGWTQATTGRQLAFYDGETDPGGDSIPTSTLPLAAKVAKFHASSGSTSPDWTLPYENILVEDDISSLTQPYVDSFYNVRASDWLEISDFSAGLLDSDTVTGFTLSFRGYNSAPASADWCTFEASVLGLSKKYSTEMRDASMPPTRAEWTVLGGPGLGWGKTFTPTEVNTAGFGFQIRAANYIRATSNIRLDMVDLTIHYDAVAGEKLYIRSASQDIGYVRVKDVVVTEGVWGGDPGSPPEIPATPKASGYLRVTDWSIVEIPAGSKLYTLPGGAGELIATLSGSLSVPALPGSVLLDAERSKYQIISYNFYASEDRNAIYGCSGAGPAFWYDGETLDFIFTGVPLEEDKPRHLAPHQHRLALGYIWGEVYTSQPGEPTMWDGALFAGTFGFGDRITGLMPIAGDALGVFTESSIWALKGAPGAETGAQQTVINHKVGAIEYTVQSIGNRPIFASFRGIETLETMDQFSDFFTAPLTYDISPWLLRRLQSAAGLETTDTSVVNSVVVRNKNQYRLFFADGYVSTLTYVGPEKEPQNTTQQYWFNSDRLQYARVFATASGVSSTGQDHAFFSAEQRPNTPRTQSVETPETDFVYELDRGRSFDGGTIEAHFHLTHNFSQQQQMTMANKRQNVMHIHGTVAGYASLRISRSVNYEDIDNPVLPYEDAYFGAEINPPEDEPRPKYAKARLTARGFAVSVYVSHESAIEFPHNIQMITFLDDEATRVNR